MGVSLSKINNIMVKFSKHTNNQTNLNTNYPINAFLIFEKIPSSSVWGWVDCVFSTDVPKKKNSPFLKNILFYI